jgi:chemotaxis protein methyltransferase CheR
LFGALSTGGWLITGSGDPPLGHLAPFETVSNKWGIFYRRPAVAHQPEPLGARSDDARDEAAKEASPEAGPPGTLLLDEATAPGSVPERSSVAQPQLGLDEGQEPETAHPSAALDDALRALADGDYQHAAALTRNGFRDPRACAVHIQALANIDPSAAAAACSEAIDRHPLSTKLRYLNTLLLIETNQPHAAARAARALIFLDRSLAIGYFLLGSTLRRLGNLHAARRSLRRARDLCARRPPNEPVPLTDGELAGQLAEAAELQLSTLKGDGR